MRRGLSLCFCLVVVVVVAVVAVTVAVVVVLVVVVVPLCGALGFSSASTSVNSSPSQLLHSHSGCMSTDRRKQLTSKHHRSQQDRIALHAQSAKLAVFQHRTPQHYNRHHRPHWRRLPHLLHHISLFCGVNCRWQSERPRPVAATMKSRLSQSQEKPQTHAPCLFFCRRRLI